MSANFPIPYANQTPYDDLRDALSLLSILDRYLDDGCKHGLCKDTVFDLAVAFSMAKANIETVSEFLEADDRKGTIELYRRVRRERITGNHTRATT